MQVACVMTEFIVETTLDVHLFSANQRASLG